MKSLIEQGHSLRFCAFVCLFVADEALDLASEQSIERNRTGRGNHLCFFDGSPIQSDR
jgi:hypothetical protein